MNHGILPSNFQVSVLYFSTDFKTMFYPLPDAIAPFSHLSAFNIHVEFHLFWDSMVFSISQLPISFHCTLRLSIMAYTFGWLVVYHQFQFSNLPFERLFFNTFFFHSQIKVNIVSNYSSICCCRHHNHIFKKYTFYYMTWHDDKNSVFIFINAK